MSKQNQELQVQQIAEDNFQEVKELMRLRVTEDAQLDSLVRREFDHLAAHATFNPRLFDGVDPQSVGVAVKDAISKGLTLDPNSKLVYLMHRNVPVGKENGKTKFKKVLETKETANGLISINRMAGRILDIKDPQVELDGNGKVISVTVEYLVPSHPSPRWEKKRFDQTDFQKWQRASHQQNARKAQDKDQKDYSNPLYKSQNGGPDSEFIKTKAIRHALKRLGTNMSEGKIPSGGDDQKKVDLDPEAERKEAFEENGGHEVEEQNPEVQQKSGTGPSDTPQEGPPKI